MNLFRQTLAFAWPYLRRYQNRLWMGILFGLLFGLSNAAVLGMVKLMMERVTPSSVPTITGSGVQSVAKELLLSLQHFIEPWLPQVGVPLTWQQIMGGLLLLPVMVALRGVASYLSSYCISWVGERAVNDLRCDVLAKLNTLSLDFFDSSKLGDLVTRVQGDTAAVHSCLERGVSDSVKEPFTILGVLGVLLWLDWRLTLFGLIFVPVCVVPIIILARKARKATAAGLDQTISLSSLLIEQMSGIRVVKAFGLETRQMERFEAMSRRLLHHNMKKWQTRGLTNPIVESVSMLGAGMLIVYAISTSTPVSSLVAFIPSFFLFYGSFKKLSNLHVVFKESSVAADRLRDLFSRQATVQSAANPRPMPAFQQAVKFEDVRFSYGTSEVLRGVDVEILRGRKLGIAGESGCGKSTLLNLLFRFYDPTLGRVAIDGVDVREWSIEDLRSQMALVSQDVVLFDLSIADNIGCGKKGATREEIITAAKAAYAHEFIEAMPEGYDTQIGERGMRLSGGQRQRLAIARAFVRNAPILVLDEATAALDSQAEAEVQKAIDHLAENRTVVCVAHRLITLKGMDEIIVLSKGEIVERGSFAGLLRNRSHFAAMAGRQGIQAEHYE